MFLVTLYQPKLGLADPPKRGLPIRRTTRDSTQASTVIGLHLCLLGIRKWREIPKRRPLTSQWRHLPIRESNPRGRILTRISYILYLFMSYLLVYEASVFAVFLCFCLAAIVCLRISHIAFSFSLSTHRSPSFACCPYYIQHECRRCGILFGFP